jgi:hypothetical protein
MRRLLLCAALIGCAAIAPISALTASGQRSPGTDPTNVAVSAPLEVSANLADTATLGGKDVTSNAQSTEDSRLSHGSVWIVADGPPGLPLGLCPIARRTSTSLTPISQTAPAALRDRRADTR